MPDLALDKTDQQAKRFRTYRSQASGAGTWVCFAFLFSISLLSGQRASAVQAGLSFEQKMGIHITHYESQGRTLVEAVLGLAYEYRLPVALEYLDRDAVKKPLQVNVHDAAVKEVLTALVAQVPEYQVSFSSGVVDVYSPSARNNPSNLLNDTIGDFTVKDADPMYASVQLWGALSVKLHPGQGYGGDFAPLGGAVKVTIHLRGAKVYQILNAIVAQQGDCMWVVRVPPTGLSSFRGDIWYLYSLDPHWKEIALSDAQSLFPSLK